MSDTATPYVAAPAYKDQAQVDALLDAAFAVAGVTPCDNCGRMAEHDYCHPCAVGNSPPLHGYRPPVALAGSCLDCAALRAENSELARQVVALRAERDDAHYRITHREPALIAERDAAKRALEELAAQVRAGKGDPSA